MTKELKYGIIIPARYQSKRLPGKPLIKICGISMIERTWMRCCKALDAKKIFVATDSELIKNHVEDFGGQVILTSDKCLTGTDRLAEANQKLNLDFIVNVQGDEPIIDPHDIQIMINEYKRNPGEILNGMSLIKDNDEFQSSTIPKVVFNKNNELIYMSRSPIPGSKDHSFQRSYKQICIYVFPKEALLFFSNHPSKSSLEKIEDIEILRFLENGIKVRMIELSSSSFSIDVPEDLNRLERLLTDRTLQRN